VSDLDHLPAEVMRMRDLLARARDLIEANDLDKDLNPSHDGSLCDCCDVGLAKEISEVLNDRP